MSKDRMYKPTLAQLKVLEAIRDGWTAMDAFAKHGPKVFKNVTDDVIEMKRIARPTWFVLINNHWIENDGKQFPPNYVLTKAGEAAIYWAHQ